MPRNKRSKTDPQVSISVLPNDVLGSIFEFLFEVVESEEHDEKRRFNSKKLYYKVFTIGDRIGDSMVLL
jgi:hypothetical protein